MYPKPPQHGLRALPHSTDRPAPPLRGQAGPDHNERPRPPGSPCPAAPLSGQCPRPAPTHSNHKETHDPLRLSGGLPKRYHIVKEIAIGIPHKTAKNLWRHHIRSISCSISSMRVAQLVAMRITVWVSSYFSQKPNFASGSSAFSWLFSRMGNT